MGQVKNMVWDKAVEFLSKVEDEITTGTITKEEAIKKLNETNYNIAMEGINSSDDVEEWVDLQLKVKEKKIKEAIEYAQKLKEVEKAGLQ